MHPLYVTSGGHTYALLNYAVFGGDSAFNIGIVPTHKTGVQIVTYRLTSLTASGTIVGENDIDENTVTFGINDSGEAEARYENLRIRPGAWNASAAHSFTALHNPSGGYVIHFDSIKSMNPFSSQFSASQPLYIGARNNRGTADSFYNGPIDFVRVYSDGSLVNAYKFYVDVDTDEVVMIDKNDTVIHAITGAPEAGTTWHPHACLPEFVDAWEQTPVGIRYLRVKASADGYVDSDLSLPALFVK